MDSGEEHRSLRISQIEIKQDENRFKYLVYTENTSKNNQGGLSHRKVKPKQVTYYPNNTVTRTLPYGQRRRHLGETLCTVSFMVCLGMLHY